jgi:hypothetical protein
MNIIATPGLLTCVQGSDYQRLKSRGYDWVSFQVWNRGSRVALDTGRPFDFASVRAAGLSPGVWGVVYEDEDKNSHEVARQLATLAVASGAEHLMFDVEYPTDAKPMISGARAGGWTGPIHLTTLGAPDERAKAQQPPRFWDYGYDLQSFLATGGGIFPQAYSNQHDGYRPELTVAYYCEQLGVPRDRVNLMIWPDGNGLTAKQWVDQLKAAGLGRATSIFLAESTPEEYYAALAQITAGPAVEHPVEQHQATDGRPPLAERLAAIRENTLAELAHATTTDPEKWKADNAHEWLALQNYLLYRVMFGLEPPAIPGYTYPGTEKPRRLDPPDLGTRRARVGSGALQGAAAITDHLP